MNEKKKKQLIKQYIAAYNSFNIDRMMSFLHPEIEFENISGGEVNAQANGKSEFRTMAEQSKTLFKFRKQTKNRCDISENQALIIISYEGVLATDLPNGMKSSS